MTYRKIGGIHWLAIGRLRISFCLKRRPAFAMPIDLNLFPLDRNGGDNVR